ncbi:sigma-54-dependent transcriptional regulator [Megalodesulfovibrio gigas]|uniref:Putative sigma-54 factor interaction domain-containing protein n=1 Tax=Megalodesulfovibrio gigas (strain ATCC 19364 / DSM 1382 / NCIMB 9332 / VKM B-1759) TaxID=1121448 RepID=T2GAB8_MEGG1|nr:sigma-54 dependent transcriptional regulator [Megalodesulfovibrio gigas]AGW13109.1 putative sigma-54 factor interaction domain-containing protein [Megalodesulfovibrio gigas DSM 1382 = ATCC 19364]
MARVLIIDDDDFIRSSLARCFADLGHETLLAANLQEGLAQAEAGADVIYLDLGLPDGDGKAAIDQLAATATRPEIIVITGLGDNYGAREALACGAWDYLRKPASPHQVKASLAGALHYRASRHQDAALPQAFNACGILGESASMSRVKHLLARAAQSEANVLITGETGVGKELAAKAVHANSPRAGGPFVVVDCSTMSRQLVESQLYGHMRGSFTGAHADHAGLVAAAHGGVLFLDEVGELPLTLQKSLLRVLQERRYRPVGGTRELVSDFRLVAATNRDLDAMTAAGAFRGDLLFRLRTMDVTLPALRERGDDLLLLARHFAAKSCSRYRLPQKLLSPHLLQALGGYDWPGNVRELGNVMEAAVIEAGQDPALYPKHLPPHVRLSAIGEAEAAAPVLSPPVTPAALPAPLSTYDAFKAAQDRQYFQQLLEITGPDVVRASQISGLSVPSIYRRLQQIGLPTPGKVRR